MRTKVSYLKFLCILCAFWQTEQRSCHTRELDLCIIPTLLEEIRYTTPRNETILNSECRTWMMRRECLSDYADKCMSDIHRMLLELILQQTVRIEDKLCDKNSQFRNDYLEAATCYADVIRKMVDTCMENVENVMYMLTGGNLQEGIPAGCCFYERLYSCYENHLVMCKKQHISVIKEKLKIIHMDTLHSICKAYDPQSEMCFDYLSRNMTIPAESNSYLARLITLYLKQL